MAVARSPFTVSQAAEIIGVHPDTMRDYCERDLVTCERTAGGYRRITMEALEAFARHQANRYSRAA